MIGKNPSNEFLVTFNNIVCNELIEALDTAYMDAVEVYRPECGSNALTFGVDVYAFACKRLGGIAEEEGSDVLLQSRGPSFRFRVGEFELGCHKVGRSAQEDIWNSFPGNRGGVRTLIENQESFEFVKDEEVSGKKFILAHMGNHEDGLCAAYICQPKRLDKNGQVAEWEFVYELWKRGQGDGFRKTKPFERLPAESVENPVLRRKSREEKDIGHG